LTKVLCASANYLENSDLVALWGGLFHIQQGFPIPDKYD